MATMLLWPTMAKLRSGSFVPALLKYENLPDIKGSAVPRSLRETPIRAAAFLVSMTGDAVSQGDIARLFDVYLQKPFSCEALMQVIEDARCSSDANTRQAA
ncbi:response regulator [Caballeronia mineralivorans]|uniref:response regulator n=1 Tax=Caballeronia mineralivorans TaxID=2010198 RepID=UPI000A7AC4D5|nr:response regulator [Caballeronia mineralivorans]